MIKIQPIIGSKHFVNYEEKMDISTTEHSMKWFFLIAPAIYLVNIAVSSLFTYKYTDVIYKKNLYVWISYLFFGVSQGILNERIDVDIHFKVLIWSFFVFLLQESISILISDVFKVKNKIKSDIYMYISSVALTCILFKLKVNLNFAVVPVVLFAAWPVLRLAPLLKKFKQSSFIKNGYLVCALAIGVHILDYAFAVNKPELIFPGYVAALILTCGISCFAFAVLIERSIMEVEIKDLLHNTLRLTALGGMAAEIAHEINNPLTVMTMNNHQMRQRLNSGNLDTDFLLKKIDVADKMNRRLIKIMEGMKSAYRSAEHDTFKAVSLKEIFEDTKFLCEIRASKIGVNIVFESPSDEVVVECRSVQITQVLQNIIYNAVDVLEQSKEKWIKISYKIINNENVEISICDSGPGVPAELEDIIFDSLFTTKINGKGTGIGLSMSRRFLEEHGGYLKLIHSSKPTTFVAQFPLKQAILNIKKAA